MTAVVRNGIIARFSVRPRRQHWIYLRRTIALRTAAEFRKWEHDLETSVFFVLTEIINNKIDGVVVEVSEEMVTGKQHQENRDRLYDQEHLRNQQHNVCF